MKIGGSHQFVRSELGRYRGFFEKNVTGFTYLFFAQSLFLIVNVFWRYQLNTSLGKIQTLSLTGGFVIIEILATYAFPFLFVMAAFFTFRYPKNKGDSISFTILIVTLCLLIIGTSLMI